MKNKLSSTAVKVAAVPGQGMGRYKDLRTFIGELEKAGELHRIKAEVDWDGEIGAITRAVYHRKGPAMMFENVKGSTIPLFCGAMHKARNFGMQINCDGDMRSQIDYLTKAMANVIPPVVVREGPCQENVVLGDNVDLSIFPSPKWHPKDGGRYLGTMGCIVSQDPDTHINNVAVFRAMVEGKNKIGFNCEQQNGIHLRKYRDLKQDMPFAMSIGAPPAVTIAAIAKVPYGVDEYSVAGGICECPIPMVKCITNDLLVPADSEIVLEGYVPWNTDEWQLEGPYGEFTGHFSADQPIKRPTAVVTAVTHRNNPILQGTSPGVGPNENSLAMTMCFTPAWRAALLASGVPGVKDVHAVEMGCGAFVCVVSLSRHFQAGNAMQVMNVIQSFGQHPKITICVDDDIDVFDMGMVLWAVASRVQPHRDCLITTPNNLGCPLDPSIPDEHKGFPKARSSRLLIDATKYHKPGTTFSAMVLDPPEAKKRVADRWKDYGFTFNY